MKPLTPEQVAALIRMVRATHEHEFDCGECLQHVGEFAERQLAGLPLDDALVRVEQHLRLCPECREDYEILRQILKAGQ